MHRVKLFVLVSCLSFFSLFGNAEETAQNLFSKNNQALFQIQMIDLESGKKSSIGSGFKVTPEGEIVTNYHVVSEYIFAPEKYRIQYLDVQGKIGQLSLLHFDVVNDLALLALTEPASNNMYFPLADSLPEQGSSIYSLGNPHDLGMIVVPGTFNGLKQNSYYQRIHFTGSINPGMSGGPTVDEFGRVVGVNVATAGNQIGFLVPLPRIKALLMQHQALAPEQYLSTVEAQLLDNQQRLVEEILSAQWTMTTLGKARVPENIVKFISCWGGSNADDAEAKFLSVENRCRLGENIFVNGHFNSGEVEVEFEWVASDELSSPRFYQFLSQRLANARPGNGASKEDVSNYSCQNDLVTNQSGLTQKTVMCARGYKQFPQLFDVLFIAASVDLEQGSLISHFTLSGVAQPQAQAFTKHFMEAVSWQ